MKLDDLSVYDKIAVWGIGRDFREKYKRQFSIDYLVDDGFKNERIVIDGEKIITSIELYEICKCKKVLIVIASSKYEDEIIDEICKKQICSDYVSLLDLLQIYGVNNKSFCLWGIDALVKDIFVRSGFEISSTSYIEVGANHPINGSATESLYLLGARGVLIEPNPDLGKVIQQERPEDIFINCGVGKEKDMLTFYRFQGNSYRNSFDPVETQKNIQRGYKLKDEISIEVNSLDDIIEEWGGDTSLTYLSLQVMGMEKDVLMGFHFRRFKFPIISIAYYDDSILNSDIFSEYKEIARVPRHIILATPEIYQKIYR